MKSVSETLAKKIRTVKSFVRKVKAGKSAQIIADELSAELPTNGEDNLTNLKRMVGEVFRVSKDSNHMAFSPTVTEYIANAKNAVGWKRGRSAKQLDQSSVDELLADGWE